MEHQQIKQAYSLRAPTDNPIPITHYLRPILLALLCLPAIWPLLTAPFFASDDGLFHLYRLVALDEALRHGILYPRIFPAFAFGYGQAVFSYYGPLVYYIAEALHLSGADFPTAIKLTFALGYLGSAWTLYMLARQFASPLPALVGAVAYVYFPYHLAETYQRGALAEHWAFVFLPLILWGSCAWRQTDADTTKQLWNRRAMLGRLSIAALILTHSLTALIFLPFAAFYQLLIHTRIQATPTPHTLFALRASRFTHHVSHLTAYFLPPILLTAFYWLPITTQSRWVGLSAGLANDGYRFHLAPLFSFVQPSLRFQYAPNQIVAADHPLSLWSALIVFMALLALALLWRQRHSLSWPLIFFCGLTLSALFMATEPSLWVWQLLHNPLSFLQYPWRFLTLVALGLSLCLTLILEAFPRLRPFASTSIPPYASTPSRLIYASIHLLISLSLILSAMASLPLRPLSNAPSDMQAMWQNDFAQKQIGATWTAEYMPWWVWADRTAIPLPRRAADSDLEMSAARIAWIASDYTLRRYQVQTDATTMLRFHQFYLPQWRVQLDGQPLATFPSTELGLLSIELPPNLKAAKLEIDFALTTIEQLGIALSSLTVLIFLWLARSRRLILIVLIATLLFSGWLWVQSPALPTRQLSDPMTTIEDFADLVGVQVSPDAPRAGDAVPVTLIWLARRETRENFKVFVHLMDAAGARVLAQSDGDPVGGFTPTSQWRVGEIIEDTHRLQIPADAPSGELRLFAGLYRTQPLKNLPATQAGQSLSDGRIPIGVLPIKK